MLIAHARPLARADDRRRLRGRQGRLRREAADARPVAKGKAVIDGPERAQADRAGRHAAAEHAAHLRRPTSSLKAGHDRQGPQGPPDLEPQRRPRASGTRTRHRPEDASTGSGSSATRRTQPFDEYRFRNWRWFWDFGGGIFTDLMVHWIDVVHWFLDLDHPATAASIGDFILSEGRVGNARHGADAAALSRTRRCRCYFEGTFSNARNGAMIEFMGTEATLYIDRGRLRGHPGARQARQAASELILGTGPRGAGLLRQAGRRAAAPDELDRVHPRAAKKPTAPAEAGVSAAAAAHLANQSLRRAGGGVEGVTLMNRPRKINRMSGRTGSLRPYSRLFRSRFSSGTARGFRAPNEGIRFVESNGGKPSTAGDELTDA